METTKQTPVRGTGRSPETFAVSRETAYFLKALKSFEKAKSDYFTALTEFYGEQQGESMYNDHLPDLDRAQQRITGGLLCSLGYKMGFEDNDNIN